jgi:DNA-binding transcriptional ArsR family regulator
MVLTRHFVYCASMDVPVDTDIAIATIAALIGDRTRARILVSLMDGRARTGTELATVAEVSPSTASVHLHRLEAAALVSVRRQGKHRYYSIGGADVASLLERLSALAGGAGTAFVCKAPERLREARTCYDHIAGTIGVTLRDRFVALGWLKTRSMGGDETYEVSTSGVSAFTSMGIDLETARNQRRRFAFGCLDWTERRCHLGGSLGAAWLVLALKKRWVMQDLDSRALRVTELGRREMLVRLGVPIHGSARALNAPRFSQQRPRHLR